LPVINDQYPYEIWSSWGAAKRELFFLDHNGIYVTKLNIDNWNYNKVYNQIIDLLP